MTIRPIGKGAEVCRRMVGRKPHAAAPQSFRARCLRHHGRRRRDLGWWPTQADPWDRRAMWPSRVWLVRSPGATVFAT